MGGGGGGSHAICYPEAMGATSTARPLPPLDLARHEHSMLDTSSASGQTKIAPASAAFEQARPSFLNPSSVLLDEAVCKVKDKATRA